MLSKRLLLFNVVGRLHFCTSFLRTSYSLFICSLRASLFTFPVYVFCFTQMLFSRLWVWVFFCFLLFLCVCSSTPCLAPQQATACPLSAAHKQQMNQAIKCAWGGNSLQDRMPKHFRSRFFFKKTHVQALECHLGMLIAFFSPPLSLWQNICCLITNCPPMALASLKSILHRADVAVSGILCDLSVSPGFATAHWVTSFCPILTSSFDPLIISAIMMIP